MVGAEARMIFRMPIAGQNDFGKNRVLADFIDQRNNLGERRCESTSEAPGTARDPPSQKSFWTSTITSATFVGLESIIFYSIKWESLVREAWERS